MSGKDIYDISREEKEVKKWKAAKRLELRNQYLKEIQDPKRMEQLVDTGMLRFYATRVELDKIFVPTVRNVLPFFIVFGVMWGGIKLLTIRRDKKEHLYRTGQVRYIDREFKFV